MFFVIKCWNGKFYCYKKSDFIIFYGKFGYNWVKFLFVSVIEMGKNKKQHQTNSSLYSSAFSIEQQRALSVNKAISGHVDELAQTLSYAPNFDIDSTYLDLEARFDLSAGKGILRDMIQNSKSVDYGTVNLENFSLKEIESLKFWEIPTSNPLFVAKVEEAVIQCIMDEFAGQLNPAEQRSFTEAVRYQSKSLPSFLRAVHAYADSLNNFQQKSRFQKMIQTFVLPLRKVVDQLEASGEDVTAIKTKAFQDRAHDQQTFVDAFVSKAVISRLHKRVEEMKILINDVKDTFDKVVPFFSTIFQQFPANFSALLQVFPEKKQAYDALGKEYEAATSDAERDLIVEKINALYWEVYLADLATKEPKLCAYLTELKKSDFDFSLLSDQSGFFSLIAQMRLKQMKDGTMLSFFGQDTAAFEKFFLELFDLTTSEISVSGYTIPVKKKVLPGKHWDYNNFFYGQSSDALPLEYELDISKVPLSVEDRYSFERLFAYGKNPASPGIYSLKGNDLGKLLFLFKLGQDNSIFDNYDPRAWKQKLDSFFDNLSQLGKCTEDYRFSPDKNKPEGSTDPSDSSPEGTPESKESVLEQFYEAWKSLDGMQSEDPDCGFKEGASIYGPLCESALPPYENWGMSWIKLEIVKVNKDATPPTFKLKSSGTERKLASSEEGKERTLTMTKETLDKIRGLLNGGAKKVLSEKKDFNQQMEDFQKAGLCDRNVLWGAVFENGKFTTTPNHLDGTIGQKEDVSYFWTTDVVPDPQSSKMKRYSILYKVKHNSDHTFSVSSEFVNLEWESKTHEHKMSYSDFLFFLNEKKLAPKTQSQVEEEKQARQGVISSHNRTWKFTSIQSVLFARKTIWKNLNSKLDEYQKEQNEDFLGYLVTGKGIYKWIWDTLGFIPSIKDAANKLHEEAMLKKDANIWKGIEAWINKFASMQDYANLFEKGFDHPSGYTLDAIIGKGNTLQKILLSGKSVVENDGLRPIMAAAMIANLRQWKGLYRGLSGKDNQGLWVKCLLGDGPYKTYRDIRAGVLEKIKAGVKNADQLQDQLKKSEVDFIVNNIRNANGTEWAFGSVDGENTQILKQKYSDKFAGELEKAANETTGKSAVEWAYGKISHNNFAIASNDFNRFIKSGRIESALWNLKKMWDLAKTPENHRKLKVAMTYVMLSGIMNRYGDKAMRKRFDALARNYMLPTTLFAKKWENQEYAAHLLNQVFPPSDERNFARATGYKLSDFDSSSPNIPYGKLLDNLDVRWRENEKAIDNYFLKLKSSDCAHDPILKAVQDKLWERSEDNLDGDWASNSWLTGHYAMLASPSTISRNKSYDRSWFTGKDIDEKNDKADFWTKVLDDLNKAKDLPNAPEFLLRQFVTWFVPSEWDYSELISWIRTANAVKNYGTKKAISFTIQDESGKRNPFSSSAMYKQTDARDVLWYLFKGKVLRLNSAPPPKQFEDVLNFFMDYFSKGHVLSTIAQDSMLKKVFWSSLPSLPASKPVTLLPWQEYNKYVDKNNPFAAQNDPKWLTPEQKRKRAWKRKYYKTGLFLNESLVSIQKKMNDMGISDTPQLSGFDEDFSSNIYNQVYHGLPGFDDFSSNIYNQVYHTAA